MKKLLLTTMTLMALSSTAHAFPNPFHLTEKEKATARCNFSARFDVKSCHEAGLKVPY